MNARRRRRTPSPDAAGNAASAPQDGFLQSILDSAPEPIMLIGRDCRILMANRAAWPGAAPLPPDARCHEISHHRAAPCNGAEHACPLQRVLAGEDSVRIVHEHFDAAGAPRLVELLASPLRDAAGEVVGIVERAYDVTARKEMEETLAKTSLRLQEAQRIARIGSWERDCATDRMNCSAEMRNIVGAAWCTGCTGCGFARLVAAIHADDRARFVQDYETSVAQHLPFELTHRVVGADGAVSYVHTHCETLYDAAGKPLRSLGTMQDVTTSVLAEMSLRESEERFRTIADYTYDWEYWEGPRGELLYTSRSCQEVTGYSVTDFVVQPELIYLIIHPDDRALMEGHRADILHEDASAINFRIVRRDGAVRWIAHGCRRVFGHNGRFMGRRASNRDITDLKEAEAQIRQLAYYDTLTGLPNRRLLLDRLDHALAQARRFRRSLAVMFLDLDRFKLINDSLGHSSGDELLKRVADRLAACVREGDTVARPGGDEFVIVLTEIGQPQDAARVAQKVIAAFDAPFELAGGPLRATTSIGIAIHPVDGADDVDDLMKKADAAMYKAKEAGRNGYRFF